MFKAELEALRATLKLSQPTMREALLVAGLYAAQAVLCVVILKWIYSNQHWGAVLWAMISAILALQPGLSQSVVTSVIRIAANTVGAGVALLIGLIPIAAEFQLIIALILVVFICQLLRLEFALRTACVAAMIVLTNGEGRIFTTGTERFTATLVGCAMALLVQLATDLIREKVARKPSPITTVKS
jgi:uncharacterized membrane protein YgaE (UPF0421/DUF939 family)